MATNMTTMLSENIIPLLISLILIFTSALIYSYRRRTKKNSILILGLSGSGKTYYFTLILHEKFKLSFTSFKENIGSFTSKTGKVFELVDIPGYENITYSFLDRHKASARGVIFIIDSVAFSKNYKDVSHYLNNIMSMPELKNSKFLILCHKQGSPLAKNSIAISKILQEEFQHTKDSINKYSSGGETYINLDKVSFIDVNYDPILNDTKIFDWFENL